MLGTIGFSPDLIRFINLCSNSNINHQQKRFVQCRCNMTFSTWIIKHLLWDFIFPSKTNSTLAMIRFILKVFKRFNGFLIFYLISGTHLIWWEIYKTRNYFLYILRVGECCIRCGPIIDLQLAQWHGSVARVGKG